MFRQGGADGISAIRHSCEHMRSHARRLNPLARGVLIRPDANFFLRQFCAPPRSSRTRSASSLLTPLDNSKAQYPYRAGVRVASASMWWRTNAPVAGNPTRRISHTFSATSTPNMIDLTPRPRIERTHPPFGNLTLHSTLPRMLHKSLAKGVARPRIQGSPGRSARGASSSQRVKMTRPRCGRPSSRCAHQEGLGIRSTNQ